MNLSDTKSMNFRPAANCQRHFVVIFDNHGNKLFDINILREEDFIICKERQR